MFKIVDAKLNKIQGLSRTILNKLNKILHHIDFHLLTNC